MDKSTRNAFDDAVEASAALRDAFIEAGKRDVMRLLEYTARALEKLRRGAAQ